MSGLTEWVFPVLSATQFLLGMLGNGFIGLVNGSSLFNKRISVSDFVITNLALSRVVLLWILLVDGVLMVLSSKVHDEGIIMQIIDTFWTFTDHLNIWLATCLSVLYCLKIASFSHSTFLWLKWRVSSVVIWMLWGALLLSCGSTMSLIHEFKIYPGFSGIYSTDVTKHRRKKRYPYELMHVFRSLWNLLPLVSLAPFFLLILSLRRHTDRQTDRQTHTHTQQMQQNGTSSRDRSMEAHGKAIQIILFFLFFFLFYFLAFLVTSSIHLLPGTKMIKMTGEVITMVYPAGPSLILILGNSKLKQMFVEMLWCELCHLRLGSKGCSSP